MGLAIGAVLAFTGYLSYKDLYCCFGKCCSYEEPLIASTLKLDLEQKLFGQHLAMEVILKALTGFKKTEIPRNH
ncbi:Hypothetical predicted protein [Marmota monax]|uniref:Uncharacterized protein n=1 Tax=Marmota monax TaxID=9995 RepID=A0A5E4DCA3_MARMO|nr:Hypothetical predicted protein [Marmota monax]